MSYELYLADSFKDAVRKLKKHYRHISDDLDKTASELKEHPRKGAVIPGGLGIRKVRVANQDAKRGKSGGYRLLYYLIDEPNQIIYLLLVYSKSEKADIEKRELRRLLEEAGLL
jgi:mRNA-degrading endonuclease RelE of RelBE toxin-antitoxin system